MSPAQRKDQIQALLRKGETEQALDMLISGMDPGNDRRDHDNALQLKARWEMVKNEQLKGIIDRSEYELAQNRLIHGIQTVAENMGKPEEGRGAFDSSSIRPHARLWVLVLALVLIVVSGWYLLGSISKKHIEPALQLTPSSTQPTASDPVLPEEIQAPEVKGGPSESAPAQEVKIHSLNLFLNEGARLKIDGKPFSGTGTMKVALSTGAHTFEITEGNQRCVQVHEVMESTNRLALTCDN